MTDQQEPEIHATANLSPVSPSPMHTAAPLLVPALQDTVDTIDAMVAAVAHAPDAVPEPVLDTSQDGIVDDDSFDGAYSDDSHPPQPSESGANTQDANDDYAKMFDSPVGSDQLQEEEDESTSVDVSSLAPAAMTSQDESTQAQTSVRNSSALAPTPASSKPPLQHVSIASAAQPAAQTTAGSDDSSAPALDNTPNSATASQTAAHQATQSSSSHEPAADRKPCTDSSHATESPFPALNDAQSNPATATATASANVSASASAGASPSNLVSSSSLPPRPPVPKSVSHPYDQKPALDSQYSVSHATATAPGAPPDIVGSLELPSPLGHDSSAALREARYAPVQSGLNNDYQRTWHQFLVDEKQYMSEAKWDRFPEGSRVFIGNLSSDKVSKREVFDVFHPFGRLAQISLKTAYGFVQYHTVEEGLSAIRSLQDIEIKGRRIHLEVSKLQDKPKKDRIKSPDRGGRARDGPRKADRYQSRDDNHRGGRNHSPRRQNHGRDDFSGRDKFHSHGRGRDRSRSPAHGRHDRGSFRRRSSSPHGRPRQHGQDLDLPRRYGLDVPDIQIILQQEVDRDFVGWVEHAFKEKGLRPEVMFLHPRFSKEQVIQRQAAEGVHAVVELDRRAQTMGRIPVQVFDRSGGPSNVRFDQYIDLDPATVGEIVLRAKAAGAASYSQPTPPNGAYQQQYHAQQQHASHNYYTAAPTAYQYSPPAASQMSNVGDLAKLVGQVDNTTLQRLLAAMATPANTVPHMPPAAAAAAAASTATQSSANSQVDINALLGALGGNSNPQAPPAANPYIAAGTYSGHGLAPAGANANANGDQTAQVQNIMAQLARYRQ